MGTLPCIIDFVCDGDINSRMARSAVTVQLANKLYTEGSEKLDRSTTHEKLPEPSATGQYSTETGS